MMTAMVIGHSGYSLVGGSVVNPTMFIARALLTGDMTNMYTVVAGTVAGTAFGAVVYEVLFMKAPAPAVIESVKEKDV
jgi:hypothetical protein